jgi:16S rRNA (cytidine1402-2'-O)-methyltransferase
MQKRGKLFLFPTLLAETDVKTVLPDYNIRRIAEIKHFIAEDAKLARRFLKQCGYPDISSAEIQLLNEHTRSISYKSLLQPATEGFDIGLMSDAGCPGIADPGAEVVAEAHRAGIEVCPLTGPSAIVLTIMASGFNGQNFAFNGYLPVDKSQRQKAIRDLETRALKQKQAQYFIETPYRNLALFDDLLQVLNPSSRLCLGINMSSGEEKIVTRTIDQWKKLSKPEIHKVPVVFGIYF